MGEWAIGWSGGSDGRQGKRGSVCDRPRPRGLVRMRGTRHARYLQTLPQPYSYAAYLTQLYSYAAYLTQLYSYAEYAYVEYAYAEYAYAAIT